MPDLDSQNDCLLSLYRLSSLQGLHYIPDYLNGEELNRLEASIQQSKSKWTQAPMPSWLSSLTKRIGGDFSIFQGQPNHVLLNAYNSGEGILAHEDGPVYHPAACILSLGASAVMHFTSKLSEGVRDSRKASVLLLPGSLLVFDDQAYTACLHGIEQMTEDVLDESISNLQQCKQVVGAVLPRTDVRYSLTIRRVHKVKRLIKLPGQD